MSIEQLAPTRITLPDGATMTYVRAGSGPTLIFLHGAMGDYRSWDPQWEIFTQHFDCISVSCRFSYPNGNTMEAPDHSAVADAEDVVALMDAIGVPEVLLVGSSYGGFASLALAANHPNRVRAVVAVEPPMMKYAEMFEDTAPVAAAFRERTVVPSRAAFARGEDDLGAMLLTGGIANMAVEDIPEERLMKRRQNIMAGRRIALSSDEFPLVSPKALAGISVPVMLVTGQTTGPIFKAIFSGIARSMPQAKTVVVEGSGHSVPQDQPSTFNALVLDFLSDLR